MPPTDAPAKGWRNRDNCPAARPASVAAPPWPKAKAGLGPCPSTQPSDPVHEVDGQNRNKPRQAKASFRAEAEKRGTAARELGYAGRGAATAPAHGQKR